ncbi:MAG: hypothetical protein ACREMB_02065 [Candidatus Rokuibacteriota bacterium]
MRGAALAAALWLGAAACAAGPDAAKTAMEDFQAKTGLQAVVVGEDRASYLQKVHRGYDVLFRAQAGEVWGRYGARLAMGEAGRALGGVAAFLTGQGQHIRNVVGSPLDRALSQAIGQPLSFFIVARHGAPRASRLDVLSGASTIQPADPQPRAARVGFAAGDLYTADAALAARVTADRALMSRLARFRSQYVRADEWAVTFLFAGTETDWSAMIREHGSYDRLVNSIMDAVTGIADHL